MCKDYEDPVAGDGAIHDVSRTANQAIGKIPHGLKNVYDTPDCPAPAPKIYTVWVLNSMHGGWTPMGPHNSSEAVKIALAWGHSTIRITREVNLRLSDY